MKLHIENINKIKTADIKLNGLTIIAGENDTGKSTVSKMLFSTIKALANTRYQDVHSTDEKLDKHISSLYKRLKSSKILSDHVLKVSELFPSPIELKKKVQSFSSDYDTLSSFIDEKIDFIKSSSDISPRIKELTTRDLDNIRLLYNPNRPAQIATELRYFIESEFMNRMTPKSNYTSFVELSLEDDEHSISYYIENNDLKKVHCVMGEEFQDATYVESPLYLHMNEVLCNTSDYREAVNQKGVLRPMLPIHIKDFSDKMNSLKFGKNLFDEGAEQKVVSVTGGEFVYNEQSKSIVFKKNGETFSPINVASGLKSFGVLQILLQTNAIHAEAPLLWDEPENHLHPGWQVEFAKIIVDLMKNRGIPMVISTHSPYFIQAVRYYAAFYDVENAVNYYLAEEGTDGMSVIEEVTTDLNRVFTKLAQPLDKIMNISEAYKQKQK